MLPSILPAFGLNENAVQLHPFGSGLINSTWKVTAGERQFILQRVNQDVFKNPHDIAHNIKLIAEYLKLHHPGYPFISALPSTKGEEMVFVESDGFFRLFPFVSGSHSKDIVKNAEEAFEAAVQFGRFTRLLAAFDTNKLQITIPSFHDLSLRYEQFNLALKNGNAHRITHASHLIDVLLNHSDIVNEYNKIKRNPEFKVRVTHHDTKISNVLFNDENKGLCVIDLDTVMPGYFISDVGDMMRTYLCPVSEEEADFSRIQIRADFYKAIVDGYYSEMKGELTETEEQFFFYAGKFMIYMQALRFLTDYLNDDVYYGASYEGHNYVRAGNQVVLLEKFIEKESILTGK
jgi:Ser/Thr protein kinase RdoA (MazF antagonist)